MTTSTGRVERATSASGVLPSRRVVTAARVLAPTTTTSAVGRSAVQRRLLHEDVEPDPSRLEAPAP